MKKKHLPGLLILGTLTLLVTLSLIFTTLLEQGDPRGNYEKWIMAQAKAAQSGLEDMEDVPRPGQPEMAAVQDYFMTLDPAEGRVPLERLQAAYRDIRDTRYHRLKSGTQPLDWNIISSNMGGRTRCIAYDPNDPAGNKVWAGAVTGGLWYNDNITSSLSAWIPVGDFWQNLSISSIVFDPNDPQVIYVGTGEAFTSTTIYRESSGLGVGIFKSADGGQSWELLGSTENFRYITDIAIKDENGTSVLYAGVVSGYYKGQNHQSIPSDGLYRSLDGGQSWMQVLPVIPGTGTPYSPADVEVASNGRIFVGTKRNLDDEGGATILYSDSGLIGSWTIFDDYVSIIQSNPDYYVPGRVMLATAPSDPDVAYALFGAGYVNSDNGFTYSQGRHIARTADGGQTWQYRPIPSGGDYFWATLAWHALAVGVDPADADHLYIGGLDVYKSENGGQNWNQVSYWQMMYWGGGDEYVHADIHDIEFKPGSSNELLITSDGGVFYTNQATAGNPAFQEKNLSYGSLQFYTCDIHPSAGVNKYVGGLQDNGTLYYTGTPLTIFDMIDGGDGAYCWIDDKDPAYMYTSVYYNRYSVWINENGYDYLGDWSSGIFINPADYDYNEKAIYANACSFGGNMTNTLLRIDGLPYNGDGDYVTLNTGTDTWFSHVRWSPYSPGGKANLFLGTLSGRLYKVEEAQSWSPVVTEITGNDFPEANISCVAIGGSEDTLLVTFSNYGVSSVWQTFDGGGTWDEAEANLPDIPVRWALYHPRDNRHAMLATELGIWTCDHMDQPDITWTTDNEGLANVRVDMLQVRDSDNTVLAATHGRGLAAAVWDITTGLDGMEDIAGIILYPNPSSGKVRFSLPEGNETPQLEVFNMTGQKVHSQALAAGQEQEIDLRHLASGRYLLNIKSQKTLIYQGDLVLQK